MKITKKQDHYLLENELGSYHISLEKFEELGKEAAIELAEKDIRKKSGKSYTDVDIDFDRASELGFCEYGINDFCENLNLDISKTYKISELLERLTLDMLLEYPSECLKLFGKACVNKFGGVKKLLSENRDRRVLDFVLSNNFIPDKQLHILACDFAENVLSIYEEKYPEDNRPRRAIEVKRLWIEEEYKDVE